MRWRLSYDGTLAALDSQLESGSPGEVTTGDDRGRVWRSRVKRDSVRDVGKAARAGLSSLWASGWRAWGRGSNYGRSWTGSALITGPPPLKLLKISWTWGDSRAERLAPFWCHDWDLLYMQLLIGLLSLKEFTELALSFKEWAENK